jgi:hypothetical protein
MTAPNPTQLREGHMRAMMLGLVLNLLLPAVIVAIGYFLRRIMDAESETAIMDPESLQILFFALLLVAVSEIPVVLFLKKLLLKPLPSNQAADADVPSVTFVISRFVLLYAVALSPSIYGLVYYLLGGEFRFFVLFGVISLLIFRLARPSQEFFYSLFGVRPTG